MEQPISRPPEEEEEVNFYFTCLSQCDGREIFPGPNFPGPGEKRSADGVRCEPEQPGKRAAGLSIEDGADARRRLSKIGGGKSPGSPPEESPAGREPGRGR